MACTAPLTAGCAGRPGLGGCHALQRATENYWFQYTRADYANSNWFGCESLTQEGMAPPWPYRTDGEAASPGSDSTLQLSGPNGGGGGNTVVLGEW